MDKHKIQVKSPSKENHTNSKRKTSEKVWDDLLSEPESITLLEIMGNEALKEYKEGKTEQGGWGD
jgi:hypothetical protein